jgi:hypothetical protein
LSKALDVGIRRAVEAWQNELFDRFRLLEEYPGARAAATEAVVSQLVAACHAASSALEKQFVALSTPRQQARIDVQAAIQACEGREGGGFSLFGGKARLLRNAADKLRLFTETRVREDLAGAAVRFYRRLGLILSERLRDLAYARERLDRLADIMEAPVLVGNGESTPVGRNLAEDSSGEAMQHTLRASNTMRVVLPFGEDHLDRSAAEMLSQVPPAELMRLEEALTKLVLDPRGGLIGVSKGSGDLTRHLGGPLVEQSTAFLSGLLPAEDVTAVELSAAGTIPGELGRRIQSYARAAAPLAKGPSDEESTFVVVPDSPEGEEYAFAVMGQVPGTVPVPVRGAMTDLLYCREQSCLRAADLFRLLEPCWDAYERQIGSVETNPHSRFDVPSWLPLVE